MALVAVGHHALIMKDGPAIALLIPKAREEACATPLVFGVTQLESVDRALWQAPS
jgi:hypothetical protein